MSENNFPDGWNEDKVRKVLAHYDDRAPDDALAEDEAATRFAIWWAALGVVAILPAAPRMIARARDWSEPATLRFTRPISQSRPQVRIMDAAPLITVEPLRMATTSEQSWPWWIAAAWGVAFLYRIAQVLRSYLYLRGLKRRASVLPRLSSAAASYREAV